MLTFDDLRRREFSRLDLSNHAYLDYTGSALYAESQVRKHHELLASGIFGNPHSDSTASRAATAMIDDARHRLLRFLGVDDSSHDVIFTANTTAAIKLVAESYPFTRDDTLLLSSDNHNSINGIREYARRAGSNVRYLPLDAELRMRDPGTVIASTPGPGLFAFPAQSNFSGVRHPLSLVHEAREKGFDVLLDIAAFAPSHPVNLREIHADYAALSFYKLFGYPTGVGALIARRDALAKLRRPWFAGGTVTYAAVALETYRLRTGHEAFEDGTLNFLGVGALAAGFDLLAEVGLSRVSDHVKGLTQAFLDKLRAMPHVSIYGPPDMTDRGGTVAFNVVDGNGVPIPYTEVEERAEARGISMRGGCFCNPGASEAAFGLDHSDLESCLGSLGDRFSVQGFAACAKKPIGAVRVSFGMANDESDLRRAVELASDFGS
jgi:selenocysteine lyase/cysteine desulfurase